MISIDTLHVSLEPPHPVLRAQLAQQQEAFAQPDSINPLVEYICFEMFDAKDQQVDGCTVSMNDDHTDGEAVLTVMEHCEQARVPWTYGLLMIWRKSAVPPTKIIRITNIG